MWSRSRSSSGVEVAADCSPRSKRRPARAGVRVDDREARSAPRRRRGRGTARRPRRRTSSMRASGRSTLLTTRITGRRASSALRSTKRVCGSGPSQASTSSSTPSTIVSPRSTSPPKSAWPGVSTMLILTPRWCTAVFLARIVMPFSRSRSIESITRSATSWLARNAPDCHSIASTSVVLPWSTCATIATLRRSWRRCIAQTMMAGALPDARSRASALRSSSRHSSSRVALPQSPSSGGVELVRSVADRRFFRRRACSRRSGA